MSRQRWIGFGLLLVAGPALVVAQEMKKPDITSNDRGEVSGFSSRKSDPTGRVTLEIDGREAVIRDPHAQRTLFHFSRAGHEAFHEEFKRSKKFMVAYPPEIEQGLFARRPFTGPITCWAFSPDGTYLAIGSGESGDKFSRGEIRVLDVSGGRIVVPDPKTLKTGLRHRDRHRKDSHRFGAIELRLQQADSRQPLRALDSSGVFDIGEVSSIHFNEDVLFVEAQPFSEDGP
jgi:hypothetical protein